MRTILTVCALLLAGCSGAVLDLPEAPAPRVGPENDSGGVLGPPRGTDAGAPQATYVLPEGQDAGRDAPAPPEAAPEVPEAGPEAGLPESSTPEAAPLPDAGVDAGAPRPCVPEGWQAACAWSCADDAPDGCGGFVDCNAPPSCASRGYVCGLSEGVCDYESGGTALPAVDCGACPGGQVCANTACVPADGG